MKKVTLKDVCTKASSNIAQKDLVDNEGTYPIYGASGFIKNVNFYHQEKPYIAIVKDGAGIGRTMLLPARSSVIGTMQYILPQENVDIDLYYLYYAIVHMNLGKYYSGATIPHIYFKDYQKEPLNLPSVCEQQRTATIFKKIDKLIASRKRQLKQYDELIKSQFIEMFGDPNVDWIEVKIADVCSNMRTGPFGSALHHDEFVDSGIFVLGIDNAVENKFSYNRMRYITEEKYEKLKRYTVRPGDVIITIMGTVGRSAVIPQDMPKAINTKHLACLTPNIDIVDSYFLTNAFQIHPEIRRQLEGQSKGAIMDGLNLTIIKNLTFRLPSLNLQKKFVEIYRQVDKSKSAVQHSLDELETLKKSLMQEYFG